MKVILTGVTGFVGEGVLFECLENQAVTSVLSVSRRRYGLEHPKLRECVVADFRDVAAVEAELTGFDACFYCAGISSRGLSEATYTEITYDTPLSFAKTLLRLNPGMVFCHISGSHTDGSEKGRVMWARVKGKAENALAALPFKAVYNFRPGLMKPFANQKNVKGGFRVISALYPALNLVFPGLTLSELGRAMIHCASGGAAKAVLEPKDIKALA